MGTSPIKKSDYVIVEEGEDEIVDILSKEKFDSFMPSILGIGDLSVPSIPTESIAAIFDLQGFTNFCKQIDPHLCVPLFLNSFTEWFFQCLREEMTEVSSSESVSLWAPLPFFIKFLGDGLLVIWDVSQLDAPGRINIVVVCATICAKHDTIFYPMIKKQVSDPPRVLRCGVARGTVYSVGNGEDFVGSCINMAARLQKLYNTSFAFNCRGFNISNEVLEHHFKDKFIMKEVVIRGIGEHEIVCILTKDFDNLPDNDKLNFNDL